MWKARRRASTAAAATAVVALLTAWPAQAVGARTPGGMAAVPRAEREFVQGELIVRFRPGVGAARRAAVRADADARLRESLPLPGVELLRLGPGDPVRAAAAEFERDPDVLYAEPNFRYELDAIPNDPRFSDLWGLNNTGQIVNGFGGTADADIDAPEAWNTTTGSSSVTVAVVDSGIAYDHPDLAPNIWTNAREIAGADGVDDDGNGRIDDIRGWDFVDNDNSPRDVEGHGTHVAGTIGARGNNGQGVAGVNWETRLMPVRACGALGSCQTDDIVRAFAYAARMGARVVNASIGSANASLTMALTIRDFPSTMFVVAAGNDASNLDAPGVDDFPCEFDLPNIVCVAATDPVDGLASFSNFGATAVDLAAPGVNVLSTLAPPDTVFSEGFEGDIGATWTTGGTNNTWARTNERHKSGSFSLTDSPGANYVNNTDSFARPVNSFSLAGRTDCALTYQMRIAAQANDGLVIERSTDASTWTPLDAWTGSTGGAFLPFEDSLGNQSGPASVYLRFRMTSDATTTDDGVHLDDLRVLCPGLTYDATDFEFLHGTSMATPQVTGTAALMWADTPGASVAEIKQRLLANVDPLPSLAGRTVTGGRVNAAKAVESAPTPVVATQPATAITQTSATLNGTVNPRGHATSYRFEYGTTTNYGQSTPVQDAGTGEAVVAVSAPLGGLEPHTTYHYRLVATYSDGPVSGGDGQFTTPAFPPLATSQPATGITTTTAVLNGTVDARGASTTYHFDYGPTTDYGNTTPVADAGTGTGALAVSAPLSLLLPDTTYHFRLVATNTGGTVVGEDVQFTTAPLGLPVVALAGPTAVLRTSATLNGTVDPAGKSTLYRFQYGTTTNYGTSTDVADAGAGTGPVAVSAPLSGLAPGATYHFRLVATNADGTTVTDDGQFTTAAVGPPVVAPVAATMVAKRSATLNGTLNPRGVAATYHFEYGTTINYGTSTPTANAAAGSGNLAVSAALSGLEPNTTYHFRVVATNADGTTTSNDAQFTTAPLAPPVVAPADATFVTKRSATLNGTVNPRGSATTYHFEYGTTTNYGDSTLPTDAGDGSGEVAVSAALSGLEPNTTYHFRLVVTNPDGTNESDDAQFTTPPLAPPVVAPGAATLVTPRSATLNGTVIPRGSATSYHFKYGTTTDYGSSTTAADAGAGNGPLAVSAPLSGLAPSSTYHFRLVATNADGIKESDDAQFTTPPLAPPVLALGPATAITPTGATVRGTVNPRGLATTYHFQYGTTTNYGKFTSPANAGAGTGPVAVTAALRNLAPATTYHFRLVAGSADGVTQSSDGMFTTPAQPRPPQVSTGAAAAISQTGATVGAAVNPNGQATVYAFQYGRTTAYGARTPNRSAGAGRAAVAVRAALPGLQPGTAYHYRVIASNATGVVAGADRMFATAAAPPAPPVVQPFTILAPASLRLDRRGTVTIRLAFPAGTPAGTGRAEFFRGAVAATATRRRSPAPLYADLARAPKRLGAKSFATRPGQTARVRIPLTRAARRLVAKRGSVNATLRVTVLNQVQTKQVRLKRRTRRPA